jgi:hypothetical protein
MKQKWIFLCAAILLLAKAVHAQNVSADSINTLKNNNKMMEMAITINEQKIQLAGLQNQLLQQNTNVERTAAASQQSASNNQNAATILTGDDQDKDKANKARKSARTAQRNSSHARDAQDKMAGLAEDVQNLEKKIADNEQKLTTMGGARYLQ